jgi:hypothetical protein
MFQVAVLKLLGEMHTKYCYASPIDAINQKFFSSTIGSTTGPIPIERFEMILVNEDTSVTFLAPSTNVHIQ